MSEEYCCETTGHESLERLKKEMPPDDTFVRMADFFKIFGDSTRVKIIFTLIDGEKCVGEIAKSLDMTQSSISHQLRTLKASSLAKVRKEGKHAFYSLCDAHARKIYEMSLEHMNEKRGANV